MSIFDSLGSIITAEVVGTPCTVRLRILERGSDNHGYRCVDAQILWGVI
jgi:hypothetical protein